MKDKESNNPVRLDGTFEIEIPSPDKILTEEEHQEWMQKAETAYLKKMNEVVEYTQRRSKLKVVK